MFIYILMYLFNLKEGLENIIEKELKKEGCQTIAEVAKNPTSAPVPSAVSTAAGLQSAVGDVDPTKAAIIGTLSPILPVACSNKVGDFLKDGIDEMIRSMAGGFDELKNLLDRFTPPPKEWTFQREIQRGQEILNEMTDVYNSEKDKIYENLKKGFTEVNDINKNIKKELTKVWDVLTGPIKEVFDGPMNNLAGEVIEGAIKITDDINQFLSHFKNVRGDISVDLLEEYDRIYDGTGIDAQKKFIEDQKAQTAAALRKATAETASAIQAIKDPGFFKSMLNSIIYSDPVTNPNFVYLNKPYENPLLEQARQIVFYAIYAMIALSIMYFLSTKTFVMPFFHTFVFWFKRYFVFIAWLMVVGLIYLFMTNWFTWLIREDVRYIAFVVNPVLHPEIYKIWNSKYKKWIKHIVYGLATLGFFIAALFLTVIILFLIIPVFLLLLWASGQLMSYFEKEELDE